MPADVDTWVMDLDNTLYPPSTGLDPMNTRIREYLCRLFDTDERGAHQLQARLVAEHGTTLRGLMDTRGIDPEDYLAFEHSIDYSVLQPNPRLAEALTALPGRKLVYTNGTAWHAERALGPLGLATCFDGVFDILAAGLVPSPSQKTTECSSNVSRSPPAGPSCSTTWNAI
jgi:putative hydrolase of the HAD superfamily